MTGASATPDAEMLALVALARQAADEIMRWYPCDHIPQTLKADHSPVTAADLAANRIIDAGLRQLRQTVPVISEEAIPDEAAALALIASPDLYWLVDPLDGTKEFLAHTDEFTVNIALMEKNQPTMACIVAPALGLCAVARRGLGAFGQLHATAPFRPICCRPVPAAGPLALVSRSHSIGEGARLGQAGISTRIVGSSVKYMYIASGEADVSIRKTPTSLWDTAAAQGILEAAGGTFLKFDGTQLDYTGVSLENPPFLALGDPTIDWQKLVGVLPP